MKSAEEYSIVFVTAPELKTARRISRAALQARLVACANLVPKVESHYWWQGKIETSAEVLIIFKTRAKSLAKLEKLVVQEHPYETPEFISFSLENGNERYLDWLRRSCLPL